MGSAGLALHDIDTSRAEDYLINSYTTDIGGQAASTENNDMAQIEPGQDVRVIGVQLKWGLYASTLATTTPSTQERDEVRMQLSIRDTVDNPGEGAGIWFQEDLAALPGITYENTTDGTGGGAGGAPDRTHVWFDPSKLDTDISPEINAGQALSVHSITLNAQDDNNILAGSVKVWVQRL